MNTATISTVMEGDSSPPLSDVLAVRTDPMDEEATSAEAWMDENSSQTPTDASGNYQFPIERQAQARECTAGTVRRLSSRTMPASTTSRMPMRK